MSEPSRAIVVTALATTPVKGLRVVCVSSLRLDATGARDDRRFHVVDERGWMVNGKHVGELAAVVARYDHDERALALTFEDGDVVSAPVRLGEPVPTRFKSRQSSARPLLGPWSQALSSHLGRELRLVEGVGEDGVDRGRAGAVSLMSRASLDGLARVAGTADVDGRRFRMTVEIDGVAAHEEDSWVGSRVRIGAALVRFRGHAGRCIVCTRDPDSGAIDLPTLDLLRGYRSGLEATEPLPLGVFGEVLEAGVVAVGDTVVPA